MSAARYGGPEYLPHGRYERERRPEHRWTIKNVLAKGAVSPWSEVAAKRIFNMDAYLHFIENSVSISPWKI